MPYPKGFLETRAVVKPGSYSVTPPEGREPFVYIYSKDMNRDAEI